MKLIKSYLFYTLAALGISLTIKASIGVSSFNSMNLAIANAVSIPIGTITILFNILFLLLYMHLTSYKYKRKYLLQYLSFSLFGTLINIFTYEVLSQLSSQNYLLNIIMLISGIAIGGLSVGKILSYNVISFPLESLCMAISQRSKLTFIQLRYGVDIVSVTISLVISYASNLPLYVREGTIISLFLFSFMVNLSKSTSRIKVRDIESLTLNGPFGA